MLPAPFTAIIGIVISWRKHRPCFCHLCPTVRRRVFFLIVLGAWLLGRQTPLFEALALVTLVKYGIWAVVMNVLVWRVTGTLDWAGWMLIVSHGAMAVEGMLYAPLYRFRPVHLALAAVWTLHNDVIDYVFGMMPRYHMLDHYADQIGYFTFWLSIASIAVAYWLGIRTRRQSFSLPPA